MPEHHILKTWPEPFAAVLSGAKRFEFRQNDRNFAVGDILHLREFVPYSAGGACGPCIASNGTARGLTGRELVVSVTYILTDGFGLPHGYCILSLGPVELKTIPVWSPASWQTLTGILDVSKLNRSSEWQTTM